MPPSFAPAQTTGAAAPPDRPAVAPEPKGRRVAEVRILGNVRVPTSVIANQVRTREGDAFDPAAVEEDYQRIDAPKRFSTRPAMTTATITTRCGTIRC